MCSWRLGPVRCWQLSHCDDIGQTVRVWIVADNERTTVLFRHSSSKFAAAVGKSEAHPQAKTTKPHMPVSTIALGFRSLIVPKNLRTLAALAASMGDGIAGWSEPSVICSAEWLEASEKEARGCGTQHENGQESLKLASFEDI